MEKGKEIGLTEAWKAFLHLLASPLPSILLICILALVGLNTFWAEATSLWLTALITTIVSLLAGVFGSQLEKHFSRDREQRTVVTRGKSAIRGLRILIQQIASLEKRIKATAKDVPKKSPLVGKMDDLGDRCVLIQEQALNAIEEWTDILPEADVSTQIGLISDLKSRESELEQKIKEKEEQLGAEKSEKTSSSEKMTNLERQLKKLQEELSVTKSELSEKKRELSRNTLIAPLVVSSGTTQGIRIQGSVANLFGSTCSMCGAELPITFGTGKRACMRCGTEN